MSDACCRVDPSRGTYHACCSVVHRIKVKLMYFGDTTMARAHMTYELIIGGSGEA
ncbi:putative thionin [Helianthus annuus]|nr:putative thionin [Helianthus annuus]